MNRLEFFVTLLVTLILSLTLTIALNGWGVFQHFLGTQTPISPTNVSDPLIQTSNDSLLENGTPAAVNDWVPEVSGDRSKDIEDVLLLYDSRQMTPFDTNFCLIAKYYGLLCKRVALNEISLTNGILQDDEGNYYPLVGISATTLSMNLTLGDNPEISVIRTAIEQGGVNLFVSKINPTISIGSLINLTEGAFQGVNKPLDKHRDWIVSTLAPVITREFTGQTVPSTSIASQKDFALQLNETVIPLISSTDSAGKTYPVFAYLQVGAGAIFLDAGDTAESLEIVPLKDLYYGVDNWNRGFAQIMPLMFTVRYVLGEEAWHTEQQYANLTLDDPALTEPWNAMSYSALLTEMITHQFHTTIAMHPADWSKSQSSVISLFHAYPTYFSLVQHGNNGDGYEFFKYSVAENGEYQGQKVEARPFVDQEADILEGLSRMTEHRIQTGIPFDKVMIFPTGISPEETLGLLKKYNFLATVNIHDVPLDAIRPTDWDYGMYQANMDYANFPSLTRRHPGTYEPFTPQILPFIFDLFLDKPALFYSHAYEGELFDSGMNAFNAVADQINNLPTDLEWRSLGYILKHLYLEKLNDDGSVDIKMYTNSLFISNRSSQEKTYHISKEETLNVPIQSFKINGNDFPYSVQDDVLTFNVILPADSTIEILITYGNE